MRTRRLVVAAAAFGLARAAVAADAQAPLLTQLSAAQHAPGLSWRQIVTPHFTVIFRDSLTDDARRAATLLEQAYQPLTRTLGKAPERIPVLLAGQSLIPNAFVSWFPRRTTWHPLPKTSAEFAGPLDWYTLLAVHEGRHIAQERHMRSGLIGLASRVFGDQATALLAGRLYFPDWLWEGDAVGIESALTPAGRGRQPAFMNRVRAMRLTGQEYPYYPAWLRSYRTHYPGAYELGFLLTSHARRKYGADVWGRVIRRATRNPLTPFALSMALKAETGRSLGTLHREAVAEADTLWQAQAAGVVETAATRRSRRIAGFHVWHYPQYASDGSIIAGYTDLDAVTRLVRIGADGGEETLLRGFPAREDFPFHVAADQVVWTEYDVHPRWGEVDYLTIKAFDLRARKIRTVRSGTRIYAVALSPAGARLAALELTPSRMTRLRVLDAGNGTELGTLPNAEDHFLTTPAWSPDGRHVTVVAIDRTRGNALVRIDVSSASTDTLIPWTFDAIARPVEHGGFVYFGSPRSGIDNIYAVDLLTKQLAQVTSRRYGAYDPAISSDGRLTFRDYGGEGDDIVETTIDSNAWRPAAERDVNAAALAEPLARQEQTRISADSGASWPVEPYRGVGRMFDVHSLAVFPGNDVDPWVVQLSSRNVLNTLSSAVAYRFNATQGTSGIDLGLSYAGLFPILDLGLRTGTDAATFEDSSGAARSYTWREEAATLTARVPLVGVRGLSTQQLLGGMTLGYTRIADQPVSFALDNNNGVLQTAAYTLFAAHTQPAAQRDLVRTGAFALARYRHTPLGGDYKGRTYMLQGGASAQGFLAHQGVSLIAAVEEQRPGNYAFASELPFARGYDRRARYRIWRAGATYEVPLWYPDLSLGPLLFVRRLRAAGFGDYSVGYSQGGRNKTFYRSAGLELTTEFVPLSMNRTWRAGVRYSYRADAAAPWRAQLILSIP